MRILTKAEIYNFQCHKHSVIHFSPDGLTVITGPSHHGKSAVVRAVRWVLYNRPQGNEFFRHGTKESRVILTYSDGISVERRKTVSLNRYWIRFADKDKKDQLFEGFGYDVPLEVQKITGCHNYKIDDNKTLYLNIAEQGEGLFLGSKAATDTQRAKILGKLAGTEDVDRANSTLKTDIYHADQDKKKYEEDIFNLDGDIENYNWVEPLGKKVTRLEELQKKIVDSSERLKILKEKKQQLDKVTAEIAEQEKQLKWYNNVLPGVIQIIKSIEPDVLLLADLMKKKNKFDELSLQISAQKMTIQNCGNPEKAIKYIKEAEQKINELEKAQQKLQRLNKLNEKLNQIREDIQRNKKIIDSCGNPATALKLINQCNNSITTYTALQSKKEKLDTIITQINSLQKKLQEYKGIDKAKETIKSVEVKIIELTDLQDKLNKYNKKVELLGKYEENIELFRRVIKKADDEAKAYKQKYKDLLSDAGICPLCGSDVNDDCLEHVM